MIPPFAQNLRSALQKNRSWSNLNPSAIAATIVSLIGEDLLEGPIWIVTPTEKESQVLYQNIETWWFQQGLGKQNWSLNRYPADDVQVLFGLPPTLQDTQQRITTLHKLHRNQNTIVISSIFAALHLSLTPTGIQKNCLHLSIGEEYEFEDLCHQLVSMGYERYIMFDKQDLQVGQFEQRGELFRIWPIDQKSPLQLHFFDTELESIEILDAQYFLSISECVSFDILPAQECLINEMSIQRLSQKLITYIREISKDRDEINQYRTTRKRILEELQNGIFFAGIEEYLPFLHELEIPLQHANQVILVEPEEVYQEISKITKRIEHRFEGFDDLDKPLIPNDLRYAKHHHLQRFFTTPTSLEMGELTMEGLHFPLVDGKSNLSFTPNTPQFFLERMKLWIEQEWRIVIFCQSLNRLAYMSTLLENNGITPHRRDLLQECRQAQISLILSPISHGFFDNMSQQAFLSAEELMHVEHKIRKSSQKRLHEVSLYNYQELDIGSFVVHEQHGIGKYLDMKTLDIRGHTHECLELEYKGGEHILVPVTQLHKISKYRCHDDTQPVLDKVGSKKWQNRLNKAKAKTIAIAHELLRLQTLRKTMRGYKYIDAPIEYLSFSAAFPYEETSDQQAAIEDVLCDLQNESPMDRLIIGDVGFGKTEVAMRAAMRVVCEGHQVAILCPTTVLALQHHQNFVQRFSGSGQNLKIAMLSRLQSGAESRRILRKIQNGDIHILIGTHAILSKNVRFSRLGLVIVDEEHRFGVKQKEKLKKLSQRDPMAPSEYLAMSATPIPRTLHMALSGLREVSVIATPPTGRHAIHTTVIRYHAGKIQQHIQQELQRGGQVFYLHNTVKTLGVTAQKLQEYLPHAKIKTAHGQMKKEDLENTILSFMRREFQILLCTSIIENGIDLPNVNTILIEDAQNLGLAQLYQLRGRVGRSSRQGYCILIVPEHGLPKKTLQRIQALQKYTALGSGFSIATADLEIRGSGNLLGKEQSGEIEAVGLHTYINLLQDSVSLAQNKDHLSVFDPEINVPVSMHIPMKYMPDATHRLQQYQKLAAADSIEEIQQLSKRWESSYGELPDEALNLCWMHEIRILCLVYGFERIDWHRGKVVLTSHAKTVFSTESLGKMCKKYPKRLRLTIGNINALEAFFTEREAQQPLVFLRWIFQILPSSL
jgi:transcription-repair coupling factor (superfamily II helicase)